MVDTSYLPSTAGALDVDQPPVQPAVVKGEAVVGCLGVFQLRLHAKNTEAIIEYLS